MANNGLNSSKWQEMFKGPIKVGLVTVFQLRGQNGPKIQFCHCENKNFMNAWDQTFTTSYMTPKLVFGALLGNLERVF